jgi:hypothetical protein
MTDHNYVLKIVVAVMFLIAFFGFAIYAGMRNWEECRAVPHTVFYCLTAHGG